MVRSKPNKITVLLCPDEFQRFGTYCETLGFKKSTLIARLIREHLDAARFQAQRSLTHPAPHHGGAR